jgi:hypothetical protein
MMELYAPQAKTARSSERLFDGIVLILGVCILFRKVSAYHKPVQVNLMRTSFCPGFATGMSFWRAIVAFSPGFCTTAACCRVGVEVAIDAGSVR